MRLGTDLASKAARAVLTLLMALAWCGVPQWSRGQAAPDPGAMTPAQAEGMAAEIERVANLYAAVDRDLPRDTFDPAFVVGQVGKDPDALFAWVRDRTAYVPYRGALRGAVGVLMDRNGNAVDRAILLAGLLQLAGHTARLAHGTLPAERADALLKEIWEDPKSAPPEAAPTGKPDDATVADLAKKYGVDPALARRGVEQSELTFQKREEDLVGAVTEQVDALTTLLGNSVPTADAMRAARVAAVRDHWWVQVLRDGKYVDLDPMTRAAKAGETLVPPAGTVELPASAPLPADVSPHEIELRIRTEGVDKGAAHSDVVLKHVLKPAELSQLTAKLHVTPLDWPPDVDISTGDAGQKMRDALARCKQWAPVLEVEGQTVIQGAFDVYGQVDPKPKLDAVAKAGASAGANAQDAIGALDSKGPAPAPTGTLTAVWLECEIRVPGEPPRIIRRDLFDAVGPARRAAGAAATVKADDAMNVRRAVSLYRVMTLAPVGFVPSPAYIRHLVLRNVVANAPILAKALRASNGKPLNASIKDLSGVKMLPAGILSLIAARRGPAGAGPSLAVHRPNLFALHDGYTLTPAGVLKAKTEIDILANDAAVRGATGADAFKAVLSQGVMETAMERDAVGPAPVGANTVTLFAASAASKAPWVRLTSADDPALASVKLSDDTRARLRDDLRAGYVVVAPAAPVPSQGTPREGWWRIDPREGTCVGLAADGAGAELAEYALVLASILLEAVIAFHCLDAHHGSLGCIVCFIISAAVDFFSIFFHMPMAAAVDVSVGSFTGARICEHFAVH